MKGRRDQFAAWAANTVLLLGSREYRDRLHAVIVAGLRAPAEDADRSALPESSKAGASGPENSQAEQSDDKAAHPPAVGGEAELREAVEAVALRLDRERRYAGTEARRWIIHGMNGAGPESARRAYEKAAEEVRAALASTQAQESCKRCGGSGKIDRFTGNGQQITCHVCNGTGQESGETG